MPLGINTNLAANGILAALSNNQGLFNQEVQRLSTGLRINSAADDPAGLVISEKYRAQVNGLGQAIQNAKDGVNLVQTAEGALQQISGELQQIRTLVLHAANQGVNDSSAVAADQQQISSAISTINRIVSNTQFGNQNLIDGSFSNKVFQIGAYASQTASLSINDMASSHLGTAANAVTVSSVSAIDVTKIGVTATVVAGFSGLVYNSDTSSFTSISTITVVDSEGDLAADAADMQTYLNNNRPFTPTDTTDPSSDYYYGPGTTGGATYGPTSPGNPAAPSAPGQYDVPIVSSSGEFRPGSVSAGGQTAADMLAVVDQAINDVSSQRAALGAFQTDTLQATVQNSQIAQQNMTQTESSITDANMAQETLSFSRAQILQQTGLAMLAQANQAPSQLLALFR